MTRARFHMPKDIEQVTEMVGVLKVHLSDHLPDAQLFKAEVAIVEALSNVVEHAETSLPQEPVVIAVTATNEAVTVDIFDPVGAAPFDPREYLVPLSDVDIWAERGRGIGLIHQCSDTIEYGPLDGQNRLALRFHRKAAD
jgi:serine/threonine-protein kinase RsbW